MEDYLGSEEEELADLILSENLVFFFQQGVLLELMACFTRVTSQETTGAFCLAAVHPWEEGTSTLPAANGAASSFQLRHSLLALHASGLSLLGKTSCYSQAYLPCWVCFFFLTKIRIKVIYTINSYMRDLVCDGAFWKFSNINCLW